MEYLLIFILQVLGIGLNVAKKVLQIDKKSPDDSLGEVILVFWNSDRITIFISTLVLVFNLVAHYIIGNYAESITEIPYYELISFGIAFVLGYAGQNLIYKYLGTAEQVLDKKADVLRDRYNGS